MNIAESKRRKQELIDAKNRLNALISTGVEAGMIIEVDTMLMRTINDRPDTRISLDIAVDPDALEDEETA